MTGNVPPGRSGDDEGAGPEQPDSGDQWLPPSPPASRSPGPYGPPTLPRNGMGVAALVLGIVGLAMAVTPITFWLGLILGIIGLPLGVIGWRRTKRGEATNLNVTIAGTILSGLAIIIGVLWLLLVAGFVGEAWKEKGPYRGYAPTSVIANARQ